MRKASAVGPAELLAVFFAEAKRIEEEKGDEFDHYDLLDMGKIGDDVKKVRFDLENCEYGPFPSLGDAHTGIREYYHNYVPGTTGNLSVIGVRAGGDWEHPLSFFIYLDQDGKTLRAYIPKDGNPYNHATKQALGNDEDSDRDFLQTWFEKNEPSIFSKIKDAEYIEVGPYADYMFDIDKMRNDLVKRIALVPSNDTDD